MIVSDYQISKGVATFIETDIINAVTDKATKILLGIVVGILNDKPDIIIKFLDEPIVQSVITKTDDNNYEIGSVIQAIKTSIGKYGPFSITIPAVKFISPVEKTLTFTVGDIDKLISYISSVKVNKQ
jgi:hypothetical protein